MPRVVSLPERLIGAVIHGCWECPFWDGSDPKTQHCNLTDHFGLEAVHAPDADFELGCPLSEVAGDA